jgi:hypothetical protein
VNFNPKYLLICCVCISCMLCSHTVDAQFREFATHADFEIKKDTIEKQNRIDPRRVMIRSAILPGWGQISNRQYWKLPIVYGLLGGCIYFIHVSDTNYKNFKEAFILRTDDDPSTIDQYDPAGGTADLRYSSSTQLQQKRNEYRKNLELSILATTGVYLLNIVDAYIGAHLRDFEISDDLSLEIQMPQAMFLHNNEMIITSGLNIRF